MKIIKEGDTKVKCTVCGAILQYDADDIHYHDDETADKELSYVICPCCGNDIPIEKKHGNRRYRYKHKID